MYFFFADHANEHIDQLQAITIQWTGLLDWTTGLKETASGGERSSIEQN